MVNNILGVVLIVTIFVALFLAVYILYKRNVNMPLGDSNNHKFGIVTQYLIVFLIFLTISITIFSKS